MNEKELRARMRNDQTDAFIEQEFAAIARDTGLADLVARICSAPGAPVEVNGLLGLFRQVFAGGVAYGMLRGAKETGQSIVKIIDERMGKP